MKYQFDLLGVGLDGGEAGQVFQHVVQVEGHRLQRQLARFDAREVEDVVDDAQQMFARVLDLADIIAQLGRGFGHQRQAAHADDGVQRGADLVAHIGQEVRLHAGCRFGAQHGALHGLGAQAEDAHEHQHVERVPELQRVHAPEVGADGAVDDLAQYHRRGEADRPADQEVGADRIAAPRAHEGAGQAKQHGHHAQCADDGDQHFDADDVGGVEQRAQHGQRGAGFHQAAEGAVHAGAGQRLLDKQVGAAGSHQREQAAGVVRHPGIVEPQVLAAQAEEFDREQRGAADEQREFAEQVLAEVEPLRQAVQQQAQTEAGQHPLQHLLIERPGVERRRLRQADRQYHRADIVDPQQYQLLGAGCQLQAGGRRAWMRCARRHRLQIAQHFAARQVAGRAGVDVDAVQHRIVDVQYPFRAGVGGQLDRDAQPDHVLVYAQRGVGRLRHGELRGCGQRSVGAQLATRIVQHGDGGPGFDFVLAVVQQQRLRRERRRKQRQHQRQQRQCDRDDCDCDGENGGSATQAAQHLLQHGWDPCAECFTRRPLRRASSAFIQRGALGSSCQLRTVAFIWFNSAAGSLSGRAWPISTLTVKR